MARLTSGGFRAVGAAIDEIAAVHTGDQTKIVLMCSIATTSPICSKGDCIVGREASVAVVVVVAVDAAGDQIRTFYASVIREYLVTI